MGNIMDIKNIAAYGKQMVEKNAASVNSFSNICSKETKKTGDIADMVSVGTGASMTDTGAYLPESHLEDTANATEANLQKQENLAVLTGKDYEEIEQEEGSVSDMEQESAERAAEKIKEQKALDAVRMQQGLQVREELKEELEQIQATGFLSQKSEEQLRQLLEEAGIPATKENVSQVLTALGMAQEALQLSDQSKAFLIEQNLLPTIENLYQGKYSTQGTTSAKTVQEFSEYEEQINRILEQCGKNSEADKLSAKWLFAHELPVNEVTLSQMESLQKMQETMTMPKVLEQIVFSMLSGYAAKDANLDTEGYEQARDVVTNLAQVSDEVITSAAKEVQERVVDSSAINLEYIFAIQEKTAKDNQPSDGNSQNNAQDESRQVTIPFVYTDGMDKQDILQVTLKRQVEEIRQKMTVQAAVQLGQKGMQIDTAPLEQIIQELRNIENTYYMQQMGKEAEVLTDSELDLFQETLSKKADISVSHAALLGTGMRQHKLLTVNELHAAIGSTVANRKEWNGVYETVSTQIRKDLGDSIQKAFENVPDILKDMGLATSRANERAVRILGYNSMEITEENIQRVKELDAQVNDMIDNMKPSVVMELIHRGENPLEIPIGQLNEELEQIRQEKEETSEEKYSRYLWQLEKSDKISPEERDGYIGIYRLLSQIEKSDGAVIGAVAETGQELTLKNLLTQARTMKGKGIDARVDDVTGVHQAVSGKKSITDQIDTGFSQYQKHLVSKILDEITPSKLSDIARNEMETVWDMPLEELSEAISDVQADETQQREYYNQEAAKIREALSDSSEAEEFLENMQADKTIGNILTAGMMIKEGFSPYKEFYSGRKKFAQNDREKADEVIDSFEENMEDEAALNEQCAKSEKIMEEILTKTAKQADISFEDFRSLTQLQRGIRLQGVFRSSHSYDIPIRTGDSVTALNLTIIRGADESGKIQVSMEDENFGNISVDVKVSKASIKGLVLCDQRQGFEALQEQKELLENSLEDAGYQVKNISYGMDFKSRNELLSETERSGMADTEQLYQIAKIIVRSVTAVIQEK